MDIFIQACLDKVLHAIAITDHHDFCFVKYAQKSIENLPASTTKPWLFPRIEITCNDAVQCIMIVAINHISKIAIERGISCIFKISCSNQFHLHAQPVLQLIDLIRVRLRKARRNCFKQGCANFCIWWASIKRNGWG